MYDYVLNLLILVLFSYYYSSSGYGLVLVSEGIDGTRHASERLCCTSDVLPEDIGRDTATALLQDIVMVTPLL